jgi:hypothetical protein
MFYDIPATWRIFHCCYGVYTDRCSSGITVSCSILIGELAVPDVHPMFAVWHWIVTPRKYPANIDVTYFSQYAFYLFYTSHLFLHLSLSPVHNMTLTCPYLLSLSPVPPYLLSLSPVNNTTHLSIIRLSPVLTFCTSHLSTIRISHLSFMPP